MRFRKNHLEAGTRGHVQGLGDPGLRRDRGGPPARGAFAWAGPEEAGGDREGSPGTVCRALAPVLTSSGCPKCLGFSFCQKITELWQLELCFTFSTGYSVFFFSFASEGNVPFWIYEKD